MTQAIRHGEIAFIKVSKLPTGLKKSASKTIVKGSHGNNHDFDNGELYLKTGDQYVIGYLKAKGTTLYHAEHGKNGKAKIADGIYEIRKQQEFTPAGLIPIVD